MKFIAILAFAAIANAQPAHQQEALTMLGWFNTLFTQTYEPKDIKEKLFGWSLDVEISKAKNSILANTTDDIPTYQFIFRNLFKSAHDYHARIIFSRTDSSMMPFRIRNVAGRFFISEIDRGALPFTTFPFYVGDEVVDFDGLDMTEAIARAQNEVRATSNPATDLSNATIHLTTNTGSNLDVVHTGPVLIGIRPAGGGAVQYVTVTWTYNPGKPGTLQSVPQDSGDLSLASGPINGFLPNLGKTVWQNDSTALFRAYIFKLDDKQIGFIRIPNMNGNQSNVDEFARLIAIMQPRTDALVIDQTNNPGGQVFYMHALAAYLIQNPVPAPNFRQSIYPALASYEQNQLAEIQASKSVADLVNNLGAGTFYGYTIDWNLANDLSEFANDYLNAQTAGASLLGPQFRKLKTLRPPPGAVTYAQPILVLMDEMDFSCADMLPAMLQDMGRAKLFGAQSSGAGGNNDTGSVPKNSFSIASWSLAIATLVRADGSYLENNGAQPDFPYQLTVHDIQNDYDGYVTAVREALGEMLASTR